jgi:ABC-type transport system involved in cytochrome bd biosynthesis fused ATPase/permease subunit
VLDEGKLIESGSHEELMVDSGYYRSIYESQLMPQEEAHLFNQNSAERGAADG